MDSFSFPKPLSALLLIGGAIACLASATTGPVALAVGTIVGLLGANRWLGQTRMASRLILQCSIIGLGAGMNLAVIWHLGTTSAGYTAAGIVLTVVVGLWLSRQWGLSRNLGILITSGTAICGGSAIAAIAGVIKPRDEETSFALATVFTLNAVALLIFPPLGHALGLTQHQFGLWAALAIHDTSSVVGAGAAYGGEALHVATTVKLVRALWIVPLALTIGWLALHDRTKPRDQARVPFPWFILGFVAAAALFSALPALQPIGATVTAVAHRALVVALFLIGACLSGNALKATGWRPMAMGIALWGIISIATVCVIIKGWIS